MIASLVAVAARGLLVAALGCAALAAAAPARADFDHTHAAWTALLRMHVVVAADGKSSERVERISEHLERIHFGRR